MQRSSYLSRTLGLRLLALALFPVAGCPDGENVSVGAVRALDLSACTGSEIACEVGKATAMQAGKEPRRCPDEPAGALEPVFNIDVRTKLCAADDVRCHANPLASALGPDGSLWIVAALSYAANDAPPTSLWLGHYAADGTELGARTIVSWPSLNGGNVQYQPDITVLPSGDAALVTYALLGGPNADYPLDERVWLQRYSPGAVPSGGPLPLASVGVASVASSRSGKLLVAGDAPKNRERGVLAMIAGSAIEWTQTRVPSLGTGSSWGVVGLAVDDLEHTTVLSVRSLGPALDQQTWGLIRFDALGNSVWNGTSSPHARQGTGGIIAGDALGNTSVLAELPWTDGRVIEHVLSTVGPDGALRFQYMFQGARGMTVERASGRVLVLSGALRLRVYDIATDGSSCRSYVAPADFNPNARLEAAIGDDVYTDTGRFRVRPAP